MMLLLPALNQMIDISTTQLMAAYLPPPLIIFVMLDLRALAIFAGRPADAGAVGSTRSALPASWPCPSM